MKRGHMRVLAVLTAVALFATCAGTAVFVGAESWNSTGAPMQKATVTFVDLLPNGQRGGNTTQSISMYNDYDNNSRGKYDTSTPFNSTSGTAYWMMTDRFSGISNNEIWKGWSVNPASQLNYLVVDWDREDRRFEIVESYPMGERRALVAPHYGFTLTAWRTMGDTDAADKAFFEAIKTGLANGEEYVVEVDLDEMVEVFTSRANNSGCVYTCYEELLFGVNSDRLAEIKAGTAVLPEVTDITIKSIDTYENSITCVGTTVVKSTQLEFHPTVYNNMVGFDQIGLYDSTVDMSKVRESSLAHYIPLVPVEGKPDVYKVGAYTAPNYMTGGATRPTSIPEGQYLLVLTHFMPSYMLYRNAYDKPLSGITQRVSNFLYKSIAYYFAPGKEFRIVNTLPVDKSTTDVTVTLGGVKYDVNPLAYSDSLTAAEVEKNNAFTAVVADGANSWTPAFSTDTAQVAVVNGVIVSVGSAESGTYIPANGYVLSATGDKKAALESAKVGDTALFENVDAPTYTDDQVLFSAHQVELAGTNMARPADGYVIYNENAGTAKTGTDGSGFEVTVAADGSILSVGGNNSPIPQGGYVLSAGSGVVADLQAMTFTGARAALDGFWPVMTLFRSPDTLAADGLLNAADYENRLTLDGQQMKDLPYEEIEAAIVVAKESANAIMALRTPGDDAAKKAAYFAEVGRAVAALDQALEAIEPLFYPVVGVENRAIWVVPAEKNEAEVRAVLETIRDAHLDTVYVAAWHNGFTSFPTANEELKMLEALDGFDALGAYVRIGHELGLKVRAWVDTLRVATADSAQGLKDPAAYLAANNTDWLLVSRNGELAVPEDGRTAYYLDPTNEEVMALLSTMYAQIVTDYKVDGVVLDSSVFPADAPADDEGQANDFGYNPSLTDAYAAQYDSLPYFIDQNDEEWEQWLDFKMTCVDQLVYRLTTQLRSLDTDLKVAAMVSSEFEAMVAARRQNALDWTEKGYVDELIITGTYSDTASLEQAVQAARGTVKDTASLTMGLTVTGLSPQMLTAQVEALQTLSCTGTALYTYGDWATGGFAQALAGSVYRKPVQARPEDLEESLPAVLQDIEKKLTDVYSQYDPDNAAAYAALAQQVRTLRNTAYVPANAATWIQQITQLAQAVEASQAAPAAKTALTDKLEALNTWLSLALARNTALEGTVLTDLAVSLELGEDVAPQARGNYDLVVTGTVKTEKDTFTVYLAPSQYRVTVEAGNVTVEDGVLSMGRENTFRLSVRVADGYGLSVAPTIQAAELSFTAPDADEEDAEAVEDVPFGEDDSQSGAGDSGNDGEEQPTTSPDTGVNACWPIVVLLAGVMIAVMVMAAKRHVVQK